MGDAPGARATGDADLGAVREAAGQWFRAHWDPDAPLGQWWDGLARCGWGFPSWPEGQFGRGLPLRAGKVVAEERRRLGIFGPPAGIATMMVAPMLMQLGTPDQQQRHLAPIATGQEIWCQLFSEPGAGSGLAGVQTRAVRDGEEWVVNGQKVWTSGGHHARWAILLARTDPDVPKHRGLTFFLLDKRQPGVEVRPLRQMNGQAEFNEVFLTEARVGAAGVVGEVGGGWGVALNVLGHERASLDADSEVGGGLMGDLDLSAPAGSFVGAEAADDGTRALASATGPGARDLLLRLLERAGDGRDPAARRRVAGLGAELEVAHHSSGRVPPSAGNLASTHLMRAVRDEALRLLGPHGTLRDGDAPLDGPVQDMALVTPGLSIAGGTDEVQRNIVGERILGLPPEPRVDKDVPFSALRQGTVR